MVSSIHDADVNANPASSGGGVGGLILAYALSKCPDIQIDVYEAASRFSEIGVGIGVWWRPWQILKSLGLEDDLCQLLDSKPTDSISKTFPPPCATIGSR